MADAYATEDDLYRHGLRRGLIDDERRPVAKADASANTLELSNLGFAESTPVQLVAEPGGALPAPLVEGTVYYVKRVAGSDSLFQLSATAGGAVIDLTDAGTAYFSIFGSLKQEVNETLEQMSRLVDTHIISHPVPLAAPFPAYVVGAVAKLAARELLARRGKRSDVLDEAAERAITEVRRLSRGPSLRDADAPEQANVAKWGETSRAHELEGGRIL